MEDITHWVWHHRRSVKDVYRLSECGLDSKYAADCGFFSKLKEVNKRNGK